MSPFRRTARRPAARARQSFRPAIERLEDRTQPSGFAGLGSAANFGVFALPNTTVSSGNDTVTGDVGVSLGGKATTSSPTTITGSVYAYSSGLYSGKGKVGGGVVVDPNLIARADDDAQNAASQAAALVPTQTLGTVSAPTTVVGNGGLNVIAVNGDLKDSLTLSGSASDFFVVNVSGTLTFSGKSALGLAGGVTADHVLYNFTGAGGTITSKTNNVFNGTLLAPNYSFNLGGTLNGAIVGGGTIALLAGANVNEVSFVPPTSPGISLSGTVFVDTDHDGVMDNGETGVGGVLITLTGTDLNGNQVTLTATTDSDGNYSFTGLAEGTYSLTQTVPFFLQGELASPGTVGGSADGAAQGASTIGGIVLKAGDAGINFNFADVARGG